MSKAMELDSSGDMGDLWTRIEGLELDGKEGRERTERETSCLNTTKAHILSML